jgi:ABC-type oligopeptide transport system substrate-binding subunit
LIFPTENGTLLWNEPKGVLILKKALAFLLLLCFLFSTVGCDDPVTSGQVITFESNTAPKNVDPLLATSQSELLAVQHLFTPLFTADNTNGIIPAAAQGYELSADQLTYTVTLRNDLIWSDGVAVTAKDFAFNLTRATDEVTKAVCAGQLTNLKTVTATNDTTLTLTLSAPQNDFLWVLSGVAGMPCRKDFFDGCGGRYGMGKDYIISNGAFSISRWIDDDDEKYLRLSKHDQYFAADSIVPGGITLTFLDDTDRMVRLEENDTDCAPISGNELEDAKDKKLHTLSHYNDSYSLILNTKEGYPTANLSFRKALMGAVDPTPIATYLPVWCEAGSSLIIPDRYYGITPYHSLPIDGTFRQNNAPQTNFKEALKELNSDDIKTLSLLYVETEGIRPILDHLAQCWQKEFGFYVTITPVSQYQLEQAVADKTFDMALCPTGNAGKTTLEVLEQFSSDANNYRSGLAGEKYDELLKNAKNAIDDSLRYQQQCEQYLQEQFIAMPLFYTRAYYAYSAKISGLTVNPYTRVLDFSKVSKTQ